MQFPCSSSDVFQPSCQYLTSYIKFIVAKAGRDNAIGNML